MENNFIKINKILPRGSFRRNVVTLMSGAALAQFITLATYPIISRLYTPKDFGFFGLFTSLALILSSISALRYEQAILLPKEDEDGVKLTKAASLIVISFSLFTFLILIFFKNQVAQLLKAPSFSNILLLLPLSVLALGLYQVLNYWASRKKQFKILATSRFAQSFASSAYQVPAGFFSATPFNLTFGQILGQIIAFVNLLNYVLKREKKIFFKHFPLDDYQKLLSKYREFPFYATFATFILNLSTQLPTVLLFQFFTAQTVGFFAVSQKIITLPTTLISNTTSQVYYQEASKQYHLDKSKLQNSFLKTFSFLFLIGLIFSILLLFGPAIFHFFLGEKWLEAGTFARYMAIYLAVQFGASAVSPILNVLRKQNVNLYWQAFRFIFTSGSIIIGGFYQSPRLSILLFSVANLISYIALFALMSYYLRKECTTTLAN